LQRAPIQNRSLRLRFSPLSQAQNFAEIVHDRLEAARREPTPGLPIDGSSRRQVMRQHHPPGLTGPHQPTQAIDDFAQIVLALGRGRLHQG